MEATNTHGKAVVQPFNGLWHMWKVTFFYPNGDLFHETFFHHRDTADRAAEAYVNAAFTTYEHDEED